MRFLILLEENYGNYRNYKLLLKRKVNLKIKMIDNQKTNFIDDELLFFTC